MKPAPQYSEYVSVRLTKGMLADLMYYANKRKITFSAVVRQMIGYALYKEGGVKMTSYVKNTANECVAPME